VKERNFAVKERNARTHADLHLPPTQLSSTLLDIYLYAPHSTSPRIHLWSRVKVARGKMDVEIMPRWWNATSSEELQIQIVESGKPPFLSNLPAGPVFTATYVLRSSFSPSSQKNKG
jgi:hypothetical protein